MEMKKHEQWRPYDFPKGTKHLNIRMWKQKVDQMHKKTIQKNDQKLVKHMN